MALTPEQTAAVDAFLAKHAGEDAPLAKAILTAGELTTGDPAAVSPKGARGLMQLTPIALKDLGIDPANFDYNSPSANLSAGIGYIKLLRDKYGLTNPLQIAAAYNAGPNAVKEAVKAGTMQGLPEETRNYVKRVQPALAALQQHAAPPPSAAAASPPPAAAPSPAPTATPASAPPPPVQAADTSGVLAHAGSAMVRGAAGAIDLLGALGSMTGPIKIPSVGAAVEPYLAPPATSLPGRIAEGAIAALPVTAATGGLGAANLALGAASGATGTVGAEAGKAVAGPVGEVVGGLVGGMAPSVVATGVRALQASGLERQAEKAAAEATKNAAEAASADVAAAKQTAETAQAHAVQVAADASQAVQSTLSQQAPIERVVTLRDMIKNRAANIVKLGTADWENFLGRTDAAGVQVPTGSLRELSQTGIVNAAVENGLTRDAAVTKATRIMQTLRDAEGNIREVIPFRDAQLLRSDIGEIYGKATRGATRHGLGELYGTLASEMDRALPEELKPAYDLLRTSRREQARLLQNVYARKVLTNNPAGQATAEKYLTSMLEGGPWSAAKQVEVRALAQAAGDEGKVVLGDALVRNAYHAATNAAGETDWARFAKSLRAPEQYRGLVMELLPAKEQQSLLHLADAATDAATKAEAARAAVGAATARAKETAKLVKDLPDPSRSVLSVLLKAGAIGAAGSALRSLGITGHEVLLGEGYSVWRLLRDPANQAALRRAARVSIDSVKGRELIQGMLAGATAAKAGQTASAPSTTATP